MTLHQRHPLPQRPDPAAIGRVVALALVLLGPAATDAAAAEEDRPARPTAASGGPAGDAIRAATRGEPVGSGAVTVACWGVAFVAALAALIQARRFYETMIAADQGEPRMREIAGFVRDGADAYLQQQYKVVAAFFVVIALLLGWAAFGLGAQSPFVPFAFLSGGFFSGLAGWFGMKTATAASSRTAAAAKKSLNQGLQIAFRSGAVMGLTVVGLGLMDITVWFGFLYWGWPALGMGALSPVEITVTMLCFGMGASAQALFARVGGGIFTKAADVGDDLVGKVEQGIPEDDPRNPATIADNVGDNVGDVAGMGADLYESYAGSILATAALGAAAFATPALLPAGVEPAAAQLAALLLPMVIAGMGVFFSIAGIYMVQTSEDASQKNLLSALALGIDRATILTILAAVAACWMLMPATESTTLAGVPGVAFSVVFGAAAGWLIGKWTEYVTSDEFSPTKRLADQAVTGPATIIIGGVADGMMSVWAPVLVVCSAMMLAFGFATGWRLDDIQYFSLGLYGVGIAAVGMLSTLGITLATDAYGPIADNAGGNAEMAGLPDVVRQRTDALDSLGNTTAATGKGFAIGSAALTALALLAAYVEGVRVGFERWGDDFATQVTLEPGETAFYKLADQYVVAVSSGPPSPAIDPGTQPPPDPTAKGYLLMPEDLRTPRMADAWGGIASGERLAVGGEGLLTELVLPQLADDQPGRRSRRVLMVADGRGPILPLAEATLPQFNQFFDATLMNPKVLFGVFLGAMATFVFCAMTMTAVGRAARGMVEEVRRQFRDRPGIMDGAEKPDYARPVAISTVAAQREMVGPSLLGLLLPVAVGMLLGVAGVLGLLMGTLVCGFCLAVYMANSGGAWDNAKKYIEAGHHGGKGTEAHKAAVVGDTVGDPFKDTSGPSLNILIKLMSMVSVVAAGLVVRYGLG